MKTEQLALEVTNLMREGKNKLAKQSFYSDGIISVEGNGETTKGVDAIFKKSAEWEAKVLSVNAASISEAIVAANHFAVHIKMDITYKNNYRAVLDEIAVYEVNDGKIVFEQYFFKS